MLQNELQRFIFKVHSSKIRKAGWNLQLALPMARMNNEIISLAGSQMLRWIDELNGDGDWEDRARVIRSEIRKIKKEPHSPQNKRRIRKLYADLDEAQFKPDYISVVIDRKSDYKRLCKGFKINGIEYQRLLGTAGGIKMSTIVFVSKRLHDKLAERIDNGRDMSKAFNPAKLEAYRALTCSASQPVSMPIGITVVPDCETEFLAKVIHIRDSDDDGEPIMSDPMMDTVKLDASDGFGLMLPSLAKRWSEELGLDYVMAGANSRFSYEKGMIFTFDFLDFAENVAGSYIIKDAWGYDVDLRNVELILTTSMLKLWDSYGSMDEYLKKSMANHYSFGLTKTTPKELEHERHLNYQFIQSFHLDDDDINELVSMSVNELSDVIGNDWTKALLFLRGMGMNDDNVRNMENDYIKAMMICPEVIDDPHTQDSIYRNVRKQIKEAKTGVIKVHGNFSIASGDPYALCQSMFGMEVTGLLKAGEIYNKYWSDRQTSDVVCFRAPMSCHSNIRKLHPVDRDETSYWYRYMDTCTIFNAWDTCMPALNGMDFDGDLVFLTDSPALVNKHRELPALMCEQSSAKKTIPTEDDFINSNIAGFGNDIGKITNRITSMYEIQSLYPEDSDEYKMLEYRIQAGQMYQQNCIDKIKGIVSKPMPRSWYDPHYLSDVPEDKRQLYSNIIADKKPYFMRYIYPSVSKEYTKYEKRVTENAINSFGKHLDDIINTPFEELSDREQRFIESYRRNMVLGKNDCLMNKICRIFEDKFDSAKERRNGHKFDYSLYKSGVGCSEYERRQVKALYDEYNARLRNYMIFLEYEREDEYDSMMKIQQLKDEFIAKCSAVCPNEKVMCDAILDVTYHKDSSKSFAWGMCGDIIIKNLLEKFGNKLTYPVLDAKGDIYYCGNTFSLKTIDMEDQD